MGPNRLQMNTILGLIWVLAVCKYEPLFAWLLVFLKEDKDPCHKLRHGSFLGGVKYWI